MCSDHVGADRAHPSNTQRRTYSTLRSAVSLSDCDYKYVTPPERRERRYYTLSAKSFAQMDLQLDTE